MDFMGLWPLWTALLGCGGGQQYGLCSGATPVLLYPGMGGDHDVDSAAELIAATLQKLSAVEQFDLV